MIMQKKAVSALVATVLLILITVAAVGIIWGAIMPMINQATQYGQACTNARVNINTDMGYTCVNGSGSAAGSTGFVLVNVERGAEAFDMQGLQITVTGGGTSKSWIIKQNQQAKTAAGVTTSDVWQIPSNFSGVNLDVPGINEARTYVINTSMITTGGFPSTVDAAVLVKVGNMEKSCSVASTATLTACRAT